MKVFLLFLLNQALLILLLSINRFSLLLRYAPEESLTHYKADLIPAFLRGFRFDFKVASFLFLPVLTLGLIQAFWSQKKLVPYATKLTHFIWIIALILIMVDQQYYAFFQSHINVLIFGFAEDDTAAVLASMWSDHPVITWLLIISSVYFLIRWLNKEFLKSNIQLILSTRKTAVLLFFYIPLHVLLMRGSITSPFPLQRDDAIVSNHPFINYLVMNPFFAVKEAIKDKKNSSTFVPESKILAKYDLQSVEEALGYLGKKDWDDLFATSPKNTLVENKKPNVVYVMMESWSGFLFDHHSPSNNLLSSFEQHTREDYLYRNILSATTSTLPAMEGMLVGKEIRDVFIWNSPFRFNSFPTALARAYQDKGYRTVFITSGKMGWRNLNQWVPKQGFEEQYGQNDILSKYDDALDCAWGVYDEYSFRLASDILKSEKEKPLFIFVMATSNHTPYEIPPHFKPEATQIPKELTPDLTTSEALAQKSLVGYQYANKALGDFISDVKREENLKEKTLLLAVGDHSSWMLAPRNSQIMTPTQTLSVPLYFHIPEYLKESIQYSPERAASQKDIVSTLIPLTLSEARYFNLGTNLFAKGTHANTYFGVNSDHLPFKILTTKNDDLTTMNNKARAYLALNHIFFQREFCTMKSSWCK